MKKQIGLLRKIVTGTAVCAMIAGLMPGQALMVRADPETPVDKYNPAVTSVSVSGINNPRNAYSETSPWRGDYIYYGGHRFRVLDTDTTDFSADDGILPPKHTMLLDSDSVISEISGEHIHFDNDGNPNQGAERANEWEYSDLKAWLNDSDSGFLAQFSEAEIKVIASSTKPDPVTGDGNGFINVRYAPLEDDLVFVLDAVEATRGDYGYHPTSGVTADEDTSSCSRAKTSDGSYTTRKNCSNVPDSGNWWLRSPIFNPKFPSHAGFVFGVNAVGSNDRFAEGGYFTTNSVNYSDVGPSPALNVDLDSILLSTRVEDDRSDYGNKYKLTLICDALETAITQGQNISIDGSTVTVPFTVTDKDLADGIDADCVSVLVVRGDRTNGTITKYEQMTSSLSFSNGTASGEGTFSLPDGYNSSTDHIYVFAEDTHASDSVTDYASAPLALMQPGAVSGLVYDGNFRSLLKSDMRTIPSGYTAVYALSETEPAEGSYNAVIPTARDAGIHRVWYKMTENGGSNTIGPKSMTVTIAKKRVGVSGITAAEKQYDGERDVTLSGGTLNSSDIISGDDISIASLEGRIKYADAGDNKPVTITKITLGGTSKDNYAAYADQGSITAKVTQKPVIVTGITAENKVYDGTKTAPIIKNDIQVVSQINGVVTKDDFSVYNLTVSKKTVAQFENAAAGTGKTVNLEIKLGGYCSGNYKVSADSQETATADITARSITIKAKDQTVGPGGTIES
nr:DUF6273 domain-containing protein [Lachnospiraceae bacterium]